MRWQAEFVHPLDTARLDRGAKFIECHMSDGSVAVLQNWEIDLPHRSVRGAGARFDSHRRRRGFGWFEIPLDTIALLETTRAERVWYDEMTVAAIVVPAATAGPFLYLIAPYVRWR